MTAKIEIRDKLTNRLIESHDINQSLLSFFESNINGFDLSIDAPISVFVNDVELKKDEWDYTLKPDEVAVIYPEPKAAVGVLILKAVVTYAINYAISSLFGTTDNYSQPEEGSSIYSVNAQGNGARLNGIVPQIFGTHKYYPDLLSQPWRAYESDIEYLYLLFSCGVGEYEFDEINIGNTPVSRYLGDIDYSIFDPADDVTGHPAYRNIYTSSEVSGFDIESGGYEEGYESMPDGLEYDFSGSTITAYELVENSSDPFNPYYEQVAYDWPYSVADEIVISSTANSGTYKVSAVSANVLTLTETNDDPVTFTTTDDSSATIYKVSDSMPDTLTYDFSGNTITVSDSYGWPYTVGGLIRIYTSFNSGVYKVSAVSGDVITLTDDEGGAISFTSTSDIEAAITGVTAVTNGDYIGPFLACPIQTTTDTLFIDFLYSGGLGKVDNDGDVNNFTIDSEIDYRVYDAAAGDEDNWVTVTHTKTASTLDDLGETIEINSLTPAAYEVRIRRTSASSDASNVRDTLKWVRLKSELEANTSYAELTTMAVKIRGTNALSSTAENKFNTVITRKLPIYDAVTETWSEPTATNEIAPVFAYIVQDSGLSADVLQLTDLDDLNTIWEARGDNFNAVYDADYTLFDSLKKLLAVGYAEPIIDNGQIKPIRDGVRSSYGQLFSYDNTQSITESGTLFEPDEIDGVRVSYFSNETWKTETIDCLLPGDLGEKPEEVTAFGITDETKAWRYGMRIRRAKRYIRKLFTVKTELEAMNANIGDLVSVPSRRTQTGYIENYADDVLYLSTDVSFADGVDNYIGVRKPDGTLSGPYVCTYVSDDAVALSVSMDFVPEFDTAQDPPLFKFGTLEQWHTPALVRTIEPQQDETATVELSLYDARVYADDDNTP